MKMSEQSRLEQLKYAYYLMRSGDPFAIMGVKGLLYSWRIYDCMHKGKQFDNPTFFTDSVDNSCEFYMGQLIYHFEVKSDWNTILNDLDCIDKYLKEVEKTWGNFSKKYLL